MASDNKKGKSGNWAFVGDSMEGIKNLRPDMLKQKTEQPKAVNAQAKQTGTTTASASTTAAPRKTK
jgi:hypothetical protein